MTGTFDASHCGNSIVAKVQDILEAFFIFMLNNEYHVSIKRKKLGVLTIQTILYIRLL